jgi:hypothetical protein
MYILFRSVESKQLKFKLLSQLLFILFFERDDFGSSEVWHFDN